MYQKIIQQAIKSSAAKNAAKNAAKSTAKSTAKSAASKAAQKTIKQKANDALLNYEKDLFKKYSAEKIEKIITDRDPVATVRETYFDKVESKIKKFQNITGEQETLQDFQKWRRQFKTHAERDAMGKAILQDESKANAFFAGTQGIWSDTEYAGRYQQVADFYRSRYYELKEAGADVELTRILDNYDVDNLSTLDLIEITEQISGVTIEDAEDDDKYKQTRNKIMKAIQKLKKA